MNDKQKLLARHALGLEHRNKKSYRNRYYVGPGMRHFDEWQKMVEQGDAWRGPLEGDLYCFKMELQGAKKALKRGESLCKEDFPGAA